MVSNAVPSFRLPDNDIMVDVNRIEKLGAKIMYNSKIDDQKFQKLQNDADFVYISVGAQLSSNLEIDGIKSDGIINVLEFLL